MHCFFDIRQLFQPEFGQRDISKQPGELDVWRGLQPEPAARNVAPLT